MLNRLICFFVTFSLILPCFITDASSGDITISAECGIVMIADTGEVVFEKNAHRKQGVASTTKIMSSLIAIESKKLHLFADVRAEDIAVEGTSMGLKAGDRVTLFDLVKGMLISSGNDAANVTASFVAGGKKQFAELMNKKAHSLGMSSTNFTNPSGLTEDNHYSTAYDMALLGSYAIKNTVFCNVCSYKKCSVSFGERGSVTLYNHNKFLNMDDGAFGIKTGFTKASGRCLVTAVKRDGVALVCVTLNAPDDWHDHQKLYDYAFAGIKTFALSVNSPKIPVVGSNKSYVATSLSREITIPYVNEKPSVATELFVPQFLYGGVKSGDYVGFCRLMVDNRMICNIPIASEENAKILIIEKTNKPIDKIKEFLRKGLS